MAEEHQLIEHRIVSLHNILYEDDLTSDDIEFYEIEQEHYEGEVELPYIGLNVEQWRDWSTEKRIEVLIHEFAHTENYADDHHPDFWDRVVELTEIAISHQSAVEEAFQAPLDARALKGTIVDSIHEYVIEPDIDSVDRRKREVSEQLGVPVE